MDSNRVIYTLQYLLHILPIYSRKLIFTYFKAFNSLLLDLITFVFSFFFLLLTQCVEIFLDLLTLFAIFIYYIHLRL